MTSPTWPRQPGPLPAAARPPCPPAPWRTNSAGAACPAPVAGGPGCICGPAAIERTVGELRRRFGGPNVHIFYGRRTRDYTALVTAGDQRRLLAHPDPAVLADELRQILVRSHDSPYMPAAASTAQPPTDPVRTDEVKEHGPALGRGKGVRAVFPTSAVEREV
jgi:hypothetical protein